MVRYFRYRSGVEYRENRQMVADMVKRFLELGEKLGEKLFSPSTQAFLLAFLLAPKNVFL